MTSESPFHNVTEWGEWEFKTPCAHSRWYWERQTFTEWPLEPGAQPTSRSRWLVVCSDCGQQLSTSPWGPI